MSSVNKMKLSCRHEKKSLKNIKSNMGSYTELWSTPKYTCYRSNEESLHNNSTNWKWPLKCGATNSDVFIWIHNIPSSISEGVQRSSEV